MSCIRDPSRKALSRSVGIKNFSAGGTCSLAWTAACELYERARALPVLRQRALRQAQEWMFEHLERSDGSAIYPAMMNAIFALRSAIRRTTRSA